MYTSATRAIIRSNWHRLFGMTNNGADLEDLMAFVAVARSGGFRDAARAGGSSASGLSEAVRRLETRLGVRLLKHACLRARFASGAMAAWEFELDGKVVRVNPTGPLIVRVGAAMDLAVDAAVAGSGVIHLFEDWLRPHLDSGALEPVLEPWWQRFPGPFLYYPGRRYLPAPLRAFVDFVRAQG